MTKKLLLVFVTIAFVASCVSPKVYKELENKYTDLKQENRKLSDDNEALLRAKTAAENELKQLQSAYDATVAERDRLQSEYDVAKASLDNLKASYDALEKNSSAAIAANSQKNRELLEEQKLELDDFLNDDETASTASVTLTFYADDESPSSESDCIQSEPSAKYTPHSHG